MCKIVIIIALCNTVHTVLLFSYGVSIHPCHTDLNNTKLTWPFTVIAIILIVHSCHVHDIGSYV